jgi:hypothetical protein
LNSCLFRLLLSPSADQVSSATNPFLSRQTTLENGPRSP